jgi:signal transduction histidine kinase
MTKIFRFSAFKLAIGYVLLSIGVLALFAISLSIVWTEKVEEGRAELLQADAMRLAAIFAADGPDALATSINDQVRRNVVGGELILFADRTYRKIAGNIPSWPSTVTAEKGPQNVVMAIDGRDVDVTLVRVPLAEGFQLLIGRDVARFRALERYFRWGLAGSAGIVLVFGALGALLVRRSLLAEVDHISRTATSIVEGHLSQRLPVEGGTTEFDLLARTLNRMLDQIEQLLEGARSISNAIAHDLRTPLAELRSRLEELVVVRPDPDETFDEIDGAVADLDRALDLFNALLRLAEIDTGARRAGFRRLDVARIALEASDLYAPVAEVRQITLRTESSIPCTAFGDPLLLAQAIANLIDNALKFTPPHGSILVRTARVGGECLEVSVSDNGPGIPASEIDKVTDRFYRGDTSRGTIGHGLGLSLVAAIVKLHSGTLTLSANDPGVRAVLQLPGG